MATGRPSVVAGTTGRCAAQLFGVGSVYPTVRRAVLNGDATSVSTAAFKRAAHPKCHSVAARIIAKLGHAHPGPAQDRQGARRPAVKGLAEAILCGAKRCLDATEPEHRYRLAMRSGSRARKAPPEAIPGSWPSVPSLKIYISFFALVA